MAEIYRHVLKKLFYPTATLRNRMEEVQQSRPPNTKLACAQIRMGQSADFKDSESFNSLEAVQNLVGFLRQFNDSARYRILFASDNVQVCHIDPYRNRESGKRRRRRRRGGSGSRRSRVVAAEQQQQKREY